VTLSLPRTRSTD